MNEMTGLRRSDVVMTRGSVHVCIVPDAGMVRTEAREVPLHPDLLDRGFMAFVSTRSEKEPLFHAAPGRCADGDRHVRPHMELGARLAKWVQKLGITDHHVDPSHAWRHRFRTLTREVGIEERVADALQGRAAKGTRKQFGVVTLQAKEDAIRRIPRFDPDEVRARTRAPEA